MRLLFAYDNWCLLRVIALLKWLEEWLSISQKRAEQGLIVLYCAIMLSSILLMGGGDLRNNSLSAGIYVFIGSAMYVMHRRPASMRAWAMQRPYAKVGRLVIQSFLFSCAAGYVLMAPRGLVGDERASAQFVYCLFFYMIDIHINGEPGRKRKLAMAELKRLFGAEWIPKPIPMPN